ncbi:hypothetical protein SAMN05216490_2533 [Mucilaginibacter mallensis]|uniref:Uncharacterized protein n=1 Tax=Mucilaginibacter mallensis TaxID=652787 RepID=A0A1H1XTR8_MUCMA|nr:hypothetical protein SAMN05216490_2533 [Mucilaginibacter mallensis]
MLQIEFTSFYTNGRQAFNFYITNVRLGEQWPSHLQVIFKTYNGEKKLSYNLLFYKKIILNIRFINS